MKKLCVLVVLTCFVFPAIGSGEFSPEKSYPPKELASRDFYKIYINSLYYIGDDLPYRYSVKENKLINLLKDIRAERDIVKNLNLDKNSFRKEYPGERVERFLAASVYRFLIEKNLKPTREELQKFLDKNSQYFPAREHVVGYQLFVETDKDTDEKKVQETLKEIEAKLKTEPFSKVAREYYQTVGLEYDGRMGRVFREEISGENFNIFFNADPDKPFFGPIRQKRGYIFGKVERKFTSDTDPVEYYRQKLEFDCLKQMAKTELNRFYEKKFQELEPEVFMYDKDKKEPLNLPAYKIKDQTVTYQEVLKRVPQSMGNMSSPDFYHSIRQKSLENDLIFFSPEAQNIKNTPEYRFFENAIKNAWLVSHYVEEKMKDIDKSPNALKRFYEQNKDKLYAQSDLVRLATVTLHRSIDTKDTPLNQHLKQKSDFKTINKIREEFAKNPTRKILETLQSTYPTMEFEIFEIPKPEDRLGRVIEVPLRSKEPGYISPVLIEGKTRYKFFRLITRQKRPPKSFDQVKDVIEHEYIQSQKHALLGSLYKSDHVEKY